MECHPERHRVFLSTLVCMLFVSAICTGEQLALTPQPSKLHLAETTFEFALPQPSVSTDPVLRKLVIELNGGLIRPHGRLRLWKGFDGRPLFSESGWGGVSVGFRVSRFAQIDLGAEFAAPVVGGERDSIDEAVVRLTSSGWVPRDPNQLLEDPVSDGVFLLTPFGLRLILPILNDHLLIGLGGGGSFLFHSEANDRELRLPDGRTLTGCAASCESRYGIGGYGLARLEFVPGAARRVGIGIFGRYTRARASGGKYLLRFGRSETHDEWVQLGGTVSIRF